MDWPAWIGYALEAGSGSAHRPEPLAPALDQHFSQGSGGLTYVGAGVVLVLMGDGRGGLAMGGKGPITDEGVAVGGAFDSDTATGMMPAAQRVAGVLASLAIVIHRQEVSPMNAVSAVGALLQSTIARLG